MTTWPNWVDLIVVTVLFRTCYNGFGRGFAAELLSLVGAVSVVSCTVNYWPVVTRWLRPWLWVDSAVMGFIVFIGFFLILVLAVHVALRRITEVIKWERLHWAIQGLGLLLGGLRGLWWSGFILVILTSSGVTYLQESVEQRSVLGPRLAVVSRSSLERIADRFPGASHRSPGLVPPVKSKVP